MAYIAKRAPPTFLVIDCQRNNKGLFQHTIYEGRLKKATFGISDLCADPFWLQMMRTDTEKFFKEFCIED